VTRFDFLSGDPVTALREPGSIVLTETTADSIFGTERAFGKWVLLANVVAWPLAYAVMGQWLRDFAYRIHPGLPLFIVSGVLTMLIALATSSPNP
jgi:putative ABC transport system permease protein